MPGADVGIPINPIIEITTIRVISGSVNHRI